MQAHFCRSALAKQRKNQQTPLADSLQLCMPCCMCMQQMSISSASVSVALLCC